MSRRKPQGMRCILSLPAGEPNQKTIDRRVNITGEFCCSRTATNSGGLSLFHANPYIMRIRFSGKESTAAAPISNQTGLYRKMFFINGINFLLRIAKNNMEIQPSKGLCIVTDWTQCR